MFDAVPATLQAEFSDLPDGRRGECRSAKRAGAAVGALQRVCAGLVLLGLLLLGGCAATPGQSQSGPPPPPVLRLEVVAPDALAALLRENLDLGRVNRLAAGEPLQPGELERLLAATPQQARALLDTEGYFNATTDVQRADGTPPLVRVTVQPGPRTLVGTVRLEVRGALAEQADAGLAHARQARQALRDDWPLPPGTPFRDADWSRAKTASLAGLRAQGYVGADWLDTLAEVDAATQRAALSATAQSGPLHRVGDLRVRGLRKQDEQTVRNIARLDPGAPATEALLLDIQERLQTSDLFDRATVTLQADAPDPDNTTVEVRLGERQLQEATVGVGVSANVGPRVTLDHVHRRPFGRAWIARNKFDIARLQQSWEGELSTQTLPGLYRNLVGGAVQRVKSDTDVVNTQRLRVGRAQDTRRIDRQAFVEYQRSTTTSALGAERDDALAAQYQGVWRRLDDQLLPTLGRVWQGQFGAGLAWSNPGDKGPFARLWARLDGYRPLGSTWFGQGRIELGQIFSRDTVRVPEGLRFRAGGDESVRGYAYRSLTSKVNGVEVGGKVLFTASLEAARPFLARVPQLWGAVFVDTGRAALSWNELKPAWGAGVGLRYRSPVGPIKLDLAYGEEERRLRLHLSVGLTF
jgi:translocation and assembly module TamA